MRPAPSLLLFALLGSLSLPLAAQVKTLQVTDLSAPGSPIHISGSLIVAQSIETSPRCASVHSQRCAVTSAQADVTLRNVGDKPILAFKVEMGTHLSEADSYSSRVVQSEKIFGPLLAPGATEPLHVFNGVEITALGPDDQPFAPATEARVVFVQFADGSIFGDQKAGENLLLMRQESLESLAQLEVIYTKQGEQAFVQAAKQPGAGGMLGIAQFEEQDGPAATIARIRRMLTTAKERLAAMSAQPGR